MTPSPANPPEPLTAEERARQDLRDYAEFFCRDHPERYEVTITAHNKETKLSESAKIVLATLAAARDHVEAKVTLCDRCAVEHHEDETGTCEACGGVFCDDCMVMHDCEDK